MNKFLEDEIVLSVPRTGDIRTLQSKLTYIYSGTRLSVPIGIQTDLGSIPQALQNIFPKDGKAMFAYILHDWLYQTTIFSQDVCDEILEDAMKSLGVSWWRRKSVHLGLKLGGFVAYNNYKKRNKND